MEKYIEDLEEKVKRAKQKESVIKREQTIRDIAVQLCAGAMAAGHNPDRDLAFKEAEKIQEKFETKLRSEIKLAEKEWKRQEDSQGV